MNWVETIKATKLREMIRKEYYILLRRKKFILMILILPILLGGIFALSTSLTSISKINIGICDFDNSLETHQMITSLRDGGFNVDILSDDPDIVLNTPCLDALSDKIRKEEIFLGINIPLGFSESLNKLQPADIYIYFDNSNPQLATTLDYLVLTGLSQYKEATLSGAQADLTENLEDVRDAALTAQSITNASIGIIPGIDSVKQQVDGFVDLINLLYEMDVEFLANPVTIGKVGVYPYADTLAIMFAIVFSILSLFSAFMLCSTNIIFDRDNNFLIRVKTSGTSFFTYIMSKLVIFNGVALLQLGLILLIFLGVGAVFAIDIASFFISFLLISSLNILIGISIGLISENETVAILTSLIFTLPFLFLSGAFFPTELFPGPIRIVADVFPLNLEIILLKKASTFAFTLSQLSNTLNILIYYFVFFFGLNWFLLRNKKK